MPNQTEVEKIIEYLAAKIAILKERLKAYESPMMQDMAKSSPHLQMDYIRLSAELNANEDNLLAIQKFSTSPRPEKPKAENNAKKNKRQA